MRRSLDGVGDHLFCTLLRPLAHRQDTAVKDYRRMLPVVFVLLLALHAWTYNPTAKAIPIRGPNISQGSAIRRTTPTRLYV